MGPSQLLLLLATAGVVVAQLGGPAASAGDDHPEEVTLSLDGTTQSRAPRRVTTADPATFSGVDTVSTMPPSTHESSESSARLTFLSTAPFLLHTSVSQETLASSPRASTASILFIPDEGYSEVASRDLTSRAFTLEPASRMRGEREPTVARGDLPPQLDSEETMENVTGLLFSPPQDLTHAPSGHPLDGLLFTPPEDLTHAPSSHPLDGLLFTPPEDLTHASSGHPLDGLLFTPPEDLTHASSIHPPEGDAGASETSFTDVGTLGDPGDNTQADFSVSNNATESDGTITQEATIAVNPVGQPEDTTLTDLDYLFEENTIEAAPLDTRRNVTSDVNTPSFLELHDKWTWFYLVLRGNCLLVDLNDSNILFSDFATSFSRLVLYDEEHVLVDSITCLDQKMTVNMSVNSLLYPECEADLQTLRSHRNLRIDLHNSSFYVESFESRRTLMFETRPDIEEDNSDVLYLTLGGVGVSLMCIVFAGILFAIYQYCVLRKAKLVFARAGEKYLPDSPRSLRPKKDKEQSVRFSKTHTYSVNMYKSYNDLSSGDLYSPLDSQNSMGTTRANGIKASANFKAPTKTTRGNGSLPSHHQELWSENVTQTTEEIRTLGSVDEKTSSFKRVAKEPEKEALHPLLLNGRPNPKPEKKKKTTTTKEYFDDLPTPPTCPASPAIPKGVLKRMDDLISNTYSSSSPNISTNGTYISAYSDTMINMSSSPSFTTSNTTNNNTYSGSPCGTNASNNNYNTSSSTASSSAGKRDARVPPTSADNLCLTRITFVGTDNPSFRMETDM